MNQYDIFFVSKLSEIFDIVNDISGEKKENKEKTNSGEAIWYRGQTNSTWQLIPKAYRIALKKGTNKSSFTKELQDLEREYLNGFKVRNYHLLSTFPDNPLSWMEIMQHYGSPTRLLDWSENLLSALFFALEDYFSLEPRNERKLPCFWCLKPVELNKKINKNGKNNPIDLFI